MKKPKSNLTRVTRFSQCTPGKYMVTGNEYHPQANYLTLYEVRPYCSGQPQYERILKTLKDQLSYWIKQKRLFKLN